MRTRSTLGLGTYLVVMALAACAIHDPEDETAENSGGSGVGASGPSGVGGGSMGNGGAGGTPGTVACGAETCSVPAEKCCASTSTCVSSAESCPQLPCAFKCDGTTADSGVVEIACDDVGDCGEGQVCCQQQADEPGTFSLACGGSPCDLHEVCQPGGVCSGGQACVDSVLEATDAKCVGADAAVACGDVVCQGDTPVCCADEAASCVEHGSLTCGSLLECDGAADCGEGYSCCFDGLRAECAKACAITVVCDTAAECPAATPSCTEVVDSGLPPGVKSCH